MGLSMMDHCTERIAAPKATVKKKGNNFVPLISPSLQAGGFHHHANPGFSPDLG